jgi:hypothetical protein
VTIDRDLLAAFTRALLPELRTPLDWSLRIPRNVVGLTQTVCDYAAKLGRPHSVQVGLQGKPVDTTILVSPELRYADDEWGQARVDTTGELAVLAGAGWEPPNPWWRGKADMLILPVKVNRIVVAWFVSGRERAGVWKNLWLDGDVAERKLAEGALVRT